MESGHERAGPEDCALVSRSEGKRLDARARCMLSVDGITLLGSDGSVRGYHAFFRHAAPTGQLIGGARRRTFDALAAEVGPALIGAFYRSQDGHALCQTAEGP